MVWPNTTRRLAAYIAGCSAPSLTALWLISDSKIAFGAAVVCALGTIGEVIDRTQSVLIDRDLEKLRAIDSLNPSQIAGYDLELYASNPLYDEIVMIFKAHAAGKLEHLELEAAIDERVLDRTNPWKGEIDYRCGIQSDEATKYAIEAGIEKAEQAGAKKDERGWCVICGVELLDGSSYCPKHSRVAPVGSDEWAAAQDAYERKRVSAARKIIASFAVKPHILLPSSDYIWDQADLNQLVTMPKGIPPLPAVIKSDNPNALFSENRKGKCPRCRKEREGMFELVEWGEGWADLQWLCPSCRAYGTTLTAHQREDFLERCRRSNPFARPRAMSQILSRPELESGKPDNVRSLEEAKRRRGRAAG